jgi:hypothetical protein
MHCEFTKVYAAGFPHSRQFELLTQLIQLDPQGVQYGAIEEEVFRE